MYRIDLDCYTFITIKFIRAKKISLSKLSIPTQRGNSKINDFFGTF